jgi:hypothetical protein
MKNSIPTFLFQNPLCPLYKKRHSIVKNCITEYLQNKKNILFILLAFSFLNGKTQTWTNVGAPGFTAGNTFFSAQAFDGTVPYVVYQDAANGYKASVMKYNGTNWVYVGSPGFSAGDPFAACIAIGNGTPYVAYRDLANGGKVTVMKYNGTNWINVGNPGFSTGTAYYPSIAVYNGIPYVAFDDYATGNKASVMKYDGVNWVYVGLPGFSAGGGLFNSIVFKGNIPYVAYSDGAAGYKTTVQMFNGTSWVAVGSSAFSAGSASFTKLGFNNIGVPFIAFQDGANANKATVMQFNGTNWLVTGTAGISAGACNYIDLSFYGSNPAVVFCEISNNYKTTVLQFNGATWSTIGVQGFSTSAAQFSSLTVTANTYYVSYQDAATGGRVTMMSFTGSVLPLSLLSFKAIQKGISEVELQWQTTNEINVAGYEIQASDDGINFSKTGFRASKNSSNIENYIYSLIQNNSRTYYRLKMIDKDGRFTYSNIIVLSNSNHKSPIVLYPNPVSNMLYIENYGELKNVSVEISDAGGKTVISQQYGTSSKKIIDVSDLPAGIYTVRIFNIEKIISTEKFIKQ